MTSEQGKGKGDSDSGSPCDSDNILSKIGGELAAARKQREERSPAKEKAQQGDTGSPPKHTLTHAYELNYPKPLTKKVFEASGRSLEKTR